MKKHLLMIALAALGCAQADTVTQWLTDVSLESGWTDFNKANPEAQDGDDYLCWAATASNVINWWQKQNASATAAAPQGGEIWNIFKSSVSADMVGSAALGFQWWLTGQYSYDETNGEFACFSTSDEPAIENNTIYGNMHFEGFYRESLLPENDLNRYPWNYELSQFMTSMGVGADIPTNLGFTVAEALKNGSAASLSLNNFKGEGHAVTLWGVDYDNTTQELTGLWLTDSDDNQYNLNEEGLFHVGLKTDRVDVIIDGQETTRTYLTFAVDKEDWYYKSDTFSDDTLYIDSIDFYHSAVSADWVLAFCVPEPATATLSLLALAGLAARRRR